MRKFLRLAELAVQEIFGPNPSVQLAELYNNWGLYYTYTQNADLALSYLTKAKQIIKM